MIHVVFFYSLNRHILFLSKHFGWIPLAFSSQQSWRSGAVGPSAESPSTHMQTTVHSPHKNVLLRHVHVCIETQGTLRWRCVSWSFAGKGCGLCSGPELVFIPCHENTLPSHLTRPSHHNQQNMQQYNHYCLKPSLIGMQSREPPGLNQTIQGALGCKIVKFYRPLVRRILWAPTEFISAPHHH